MSKTLKDHIKASDKTAAFRKEIAVIKRLLKDPKTDRAALLERVDRLESAVNKLASKWATEEVKMRAHKMKKIR